MISLRDNITRLLIFNVFDSDFEDIKKTEYVNSPYKLNYLRFISTNSTGTGWPSDDLGFLTSIKKECDLKCYEEGTPDSKRQKLSLNYEAELVRDKIDFTSTSRKGEHVSQISLDKQGEVLPNAETFSESQSQQIVNTKLEKVSSLPSLVRDFLLTRDYLKNDSLTTFKVPNVESSELEKKQSILYLNSLLKGLKENESLLFFQNDWFMNFPKLDKFVSIFIIEKTGSNYTLKKFINPDSLSLSEVNQGNIEFRRISDRDGYNISIECNGLSYSISNFHVIKKATDIESLTKAQLHSKAHVSNFIDDKIDSGEYLTIPELREKIFGGSEVIQDQYNGNEDKLHQKQYLDELILKQHQHESFLFINPTYYNEDYTGMVSLGIGTDVGVILDPNGLSKGSRVNFNVKIVHMIKWNRGYKYFIRSSDFKGMVKFRYDTNTITLVEKGTKARFPISKLILVRRKDT